MSMCAFVRPDRKLGDVALQRVIRELNLRVAILAASCRRVEQSERPGIGDQAALVTIACLGGASNAGRASTLANLVRSALKKVLLAVVAVREDEVVIEDEVRIVKKIHHNGQIRHRNQARRDPTAIHMLAPYI